MSFDDRGPVDGGTDAPPKHPAPWYFWVLLPLAAVTCVGLLFAAVALLLRLLRPY
jgi:hypothetical protein